MIRNIFTPADRSRKYDIPTPSPVLSVSPGLRMHENTRSYSPGKANSVGASSNVAGSLSRNDGNVVTVLFKPLFVNLEVHVENVESVALIQDEVPVKVTMTESSSSEEEESVRSSPWGSIFNLVNTILGSGILAFPYAIQSTGLFLGIIVVVFFIIISIYTLRTVFKAWMIVKQRHGEIIHSYEDLSAFFYGKPMKFIHQFLMGIYLLGVCIVFMKITADSFSPILQYLIGEEFCLTRPVLVSFIFSVFFVYPLTLLRKVDALRFTSLLSLLSVGLLFILIPVSYIVNTIITKDPFVNISKKSDLLMNTRLEMGVYPRFFMTLPLISFSMDCHVMVPVISSQLKNPSMCKLDFIGITSLVIVGFLYLTVGVFGYLRFGDHLESDVLQSFRSGNNVVDIVIVVIGRISMGFVSICSYPLASFPLRTCIMSISCDVLDFFRKCCCCCSLIGRDKKTKMKGTFVEMSEARESQRRKSSSSEEDLGTCTYLCVNTAAFVICLGSSFVVPELSGAIGGTFQMFLIPALLMWKMRSMSPIKVKNWDNDAEDDEMNKVIFDRYYEEYMKSDSYGEEQDDDDDDDQKDEKEGKKKFKFLLDSCCCCWKWVKCFCNVMVFCERWICSWICLLFSVGLAIVGIIATVFEILKSE